MIIEGFTATVDYGRSIKDAIEIGRYEEVYQEITDHNFPPKENEEGSKDLQFFLYRFDYLAESSRIIQWMRRDGRRPATLRELLAFDHSHPGICRDFRIVALGSTVALSSILGLKWLYRLFGERSVPCLGMSKATSKKYLRLFFDSSEWGGFCFLAVEDERTD